MTAPTPSSKPFEGSGYDLDTYRQYRIIYEPPFYDLIYAYHTSHNGQWNLAHDVGTGPGMVAEALATRFASVVASDINANQINAARQRFEKTHPNVRFEHCHAEDVARLGVDGKADLVAVAECIALFKIDEAMAAFAELLKPGGTLAVWFYGRLIFAEEGRDKCQEIHDRIVAKAAQKMGSSKGNPVMEARRNALAGWLDNLAFPKDAWRDVKRLKWNHDKPLGFLNNEDLGFKAEWETRIADNEVVEEKIDRDFWAKEDCDIDWIKGFVGNMLPWPPNAEIDAQLDVLYDKLEEAMGGKNAKHKVCWPVVLLLATKQ
ncbi:MAG: hypothetical protein Q9195_005915 [Heterodermia aff. obscurata]